MKFQFNLLGNGKAVSLAKSCMLADPDSILQPTPPSYAASGLTFRAVNGWHHDTNRDSPSRAASASAFLCRGGVSPGFLMVNGLPFATGSKSLEAAWNDRFAEYPSPTPLT
jgi:hypothetical protein